MTDGPRILTLDIETSPSIAHVWGLFDQTVSLSQLQQSTRVIAFAAKWYGEDEVLFFSEFHQGHDLMVKAAHELLDEADIVVHYNGAKFDIPHLNREFVMAGMTPPAPYKQVDLFKVVKRSFRFVSNKLQHVSTELGLEGKVQHSGHELWVRCMAGVPEAWAEMEEYNVQDVRLTEELYVVLLPWISDHPHMGLFVDVAKPVCHKCQSDRMQKRGFYRTGVSIFQRYQCQNCGGWSRGGQRISGVDVRGVAG